MESTINTKNTRQEGKLIYFNYFLDSSEEMTIKIQTLDNIFPLVVKKNFSVQEVKEKILEGKKQIEEGNVTDGEIVFQRLQARLKQIQQHP
jgi:antitoxin ParD1/3/4